MRSVKLVAVVLLFGAAACTVDVSSREVMLDTLQTQGGLSPEAASCVADKMFDKYTQDQLDDVALGFTDENGQEKIPGITDFSSEAIASCISAG